MCVDKAERIVYPFRTMKLNDYYIKKKFRNQRDFARFLDVDPASLNRWLKGTRSISKKAAVHIDKKTNGEVSLRDSLL